MKNILLLGVLFLSSQVMAHGENKPGPNGGFIRMPGAFHTEVVPAGKSKIQVYLLDINWKDPMTKGSSVSVDIDSLGKKITTACIAKDDLFECDLKDQDIAQKGSLIVNAKRSDQKGKAVYALPLSLSLPKSESKHGSHH